MSTHHMKTRHARSNEGLKHTQGVGKVSHAQTHSRCGESKSRSNTLKVWGKQVALKHTQGVGEVSHAQTHSRCGESKSRSNTLKVWGKQVTLKHTQGVGKVSHAAALFRSKFTPPTHPFPSLRPFRHARLFRILPVTLFFAHF